MMTMKKIICYNYLNKGIILMLKKEQNIGVAKTVINWYIPTYGKIIFQTKEMRNSVKGIND